MDEIAAGHERVRAERHPDGLRPGSAKTILLTVLGELARGTGEPAWTAALLYVMDGLGLDQQASRQAISRAAKSGWIQPERIGRAVRWQITEAGEALFQQGARRTAALSDPYLDWNGSWLIVFVTVPASRKNLRKRLYTGLTWAGLGNPAPGVWVGPHADRSAEVEQIIHTFELNTAALSFIGSVGRIGLPESEIVNRGWDLAEIAKRYRSLQNHVTGVEPSSDDQRLFEHIEMVSQLQRFPFSDPQLPEAILPGWIGRATAQLVEERRAEWVPSVRARWQEINRRS